MASGKYFKLLKSTYEVKQSVRTTNVVSERDFALLDRFVRNQTPAPLLLKLTKFSPTTKLLVGYKLSLKKSATHC